MNKILITVYVAALDETYDILVPINIGVNDFYEMIQSTISELSSGNYVIHDNVMMFDINGNIINSNNLIRLSGLTNGCKVVLV